MRFALRQRRTFASLILGLWLFGLFVGVVNACLPGEPLDSHPAPHALMSGHHSDQSSPSDCVKFCNEDTPLFAKLKLVQDQPAGQPLLVAAVVKLVSVEPSIRVAPTLLAHPPPDVPLYLRSHRLAL
jgi:hypothetical protein